MGNKVIIETDECIGCESRVKLCPDALTFNETEEKTQAIRYEDGSTDCIEETMKTCPVDCIHWEN